MTPEFPRINSAIRWTLEYYTIDRIKPHMKRFAESTVEWANPDLWDDWIKTTLGLHAAMEREINQTIVGSTEYLNVYMFENLKRWLEDYRIKNVNREIIEQRIDEHNEKNYADFTEKIEKKVEEFKSHPNYSRQHKEIYTEEYTPIWAFVSLHNRGLKLKREVTYYKFYIIEERPDLIDLQYLDKYCLIVEKIINSFKNSITQYVELYESKKLSFWNNLPQRQIQLLQDNEIRILKEPERDKKIVVDLSVPKLVYLFKMIYEIEPSIFDKGVKKTDLARLIVSNFTTPGKQGKDIGYNSVENMLSKDGTDKDVAQFWVKKLEEMLKAAKKV